MQRANRVAVITQLASPSPTLGKREMTVRRAKLMAAVAQLASPKPLGRDVTGWGTNRMAATAQLASAVSVGVEIFVRRMIWMATKARLVSPALVGADVIGQKTRGPTHEMGELGSSNSLARFYGTWRGEHDCVEDKSGDRVTTTAQLTSLTLGEWDVTVQKEYRVTG